jgi:hypothetical protein
MGTPPESVWTDKEGRRRLALELLELELRRSLGGWVMSSRIMVSF